MLVGITLLVYRMFLTNILPAAHFPPCYLQTAGHLYQEPVVSLTDPLQAKLTIFMKSTDAGWVRANTDNYAFIEILTQLHLFVSHYTLSMLSMSVCQYRGPTVSSSSI